METRKTQKAGLQYDDSEQLPLGSFTPCEKLVGDVHPRTASIPQGQNGVQTSEELPGGKYVNRV